MSYFNRHNKPTPGAIKAVYAHLDCLVDGIDELKRAGFKAGDFVVASPLPRHEIEEQIYEGRPSPIRWFTLAGALFGGTSGFTLASLTHLNWPMIIPAGKPLVSIPAFVILTFEPTVLMGCLFTFIGLLLFCRLPATDLQFEIKDRRFSDDKFGIIVNGLNPERAAKIRELLFSTGAIEITGSVLEQQEAAHA